MTISCSSEIPVATAAIDEYLANGWPQITWPAAGGPLGNLKQLYAAEAACGGTVFPNSTDLPGRAEGGPVPLFVPDWLLEQSPRTSSAALDIVQLQGELCSSTATLQIYLDDQAACDDGCIGDDPCHAELEGPPPCWVCEQMSQVAPCYAQSVQPGGTAQLAASPAGPRYEGWPAVPAPASDAGGSRSCKSLSAAAAAAAAAGAAYKQQLCNVMPASGRLWQVHDTKGLQGYLWHGLLVSLLLMGLACLHERALGWAGLPVRRRLLLVVLQHGAPLFPVAAFLLSAYPILSLWQHKQAPLNFMNAALEQSYCSWFHAGRGPSDAAFAGLWLLITAVLWSGASAAGWLGPSSLWRLAACMAGPAAVLAAVLLMPPQRYAAKREGLLLWCHACTGLGMLLLQPSRLQDLFATAAVGGVHNSSAATGFPLLLPCALHLLLLLCMQMRMSAALSYQLLHSVVLFVAVGSAGTLLQAGVAFGFGMCLPLLLVQHMEVVARDAFMTLLGVRSKGASR